LQKDKLLIYGKHPVFLCLELQKRQTYKIFISKNNQQTLLDFLQKNNLNNLSKLIQIVDNKFFDNLLGKNAVHQGFALEVSKIAMQNNALEHGLEKAIQWFSNIPDHWTKQNWQQGRLIVCDTSCGENNPYQHDQITSNQHAT
jgi:tRNA G18 (ribose-2'-O)-methylase SpoU